MTSIEKQCEILGSFYLNYRDDKSLGEFFEFNDIGIPLAYLSSEGLCQLTNLAIIYIEETFNMLLASMQLEDIGFDSLDHLLSTAAEAGGIEEK